jgi:S1-C subfamily serine protease
MKNLKFGVFYLGLAAMIVAMVSGLSAQTPSTRQSSQANSGSPRPGRPDVMVLDGRGSELGAMVSDLDAKSATAGVKIDAVHSDSPAEKAGLKAGDIVVDYDGERVRSARQFTRLVQETPEGRSVAIGIMRDGKTQTVHATPEADG